MNKATDAKMVVEEAQREQRRKMEDQGTQHVQTFFEHRDGRWVPKIEYVPSIYSLFYLLTFFPSLPLDPKSAAQVVASWLFGPQLSTLT